MPRRYHYDDDDEIVYHETSDVEVEAAVGRDQERRAKERGEVYDYQELGETLHQYMDHCRRYGLKSVSYPHLIPNT